MAFDDESYMQRRLAEQRRRRTEPVFNPTVDDLSQRGVLRRSQTSMFNPTADELAARGAVRRPELVFNPAADELTRRGVTGPQSKDFGTVIGAPQDEGNYSTPSNFGYEQRIFGDTAGADKERLQRISDVDSALSDLRLSAGGLNMRSKRDLFGQLLGEKNRLTSQAYGAQTERAIAGARQASDEAQAAARLSANAQEGNAERRQRQNQFNASSRQNDSQFNRRLSAQRQQDAVMAQLLREQQGYKNEQLRNAEDRQAALDYKSADPEMSWEQARNLVLQDRIADNASPTGSRVSASAFEGVKRRTAEAFTPHFMTNPIAPSDSEELSFMDDRVPRSLRPDDVTLGGPSVGRWISTFGQRPYEASFTDAKGNRVKTGVSRDDRDYIEGYQRRQR